MTLAIRILLIAIVGELAVAGVFISNRLAVPQPPLPDLRLIDSATAVDLKALRENLAVERSEDWLILAKAYVAFGYYSEAEACSRRAVELSPDSVDANFHWGLTLDRLGRLQEAKERLRRVPVLTTGPLSLEAWYRIGRIELRQEQIEDAEAAFRKTDGFPPSMFQLAKILVRTNRADQVLTIVGQMLDDAPNVLHTLLLRAQVARALGDFAGVQEFNERAERALARLDIGRTVVLFTNTRAQYGAWRMYNDVGDLEQSGDLMSASRLLREANQVYWLESVVPAMARIEIKLGRNEAAIQLLEEQFERAGESPATLERLGDVFLSMGEDKKAQQIWERAVGMRSGEKQRRLHQKLGELYDRQGDKSAARNQRGRAHFTSGFVAFRRNELSKALVDFRKAVELNPQLAHSWFYLGQIHSVLGHQGKARNAYESCLKLAPDHGRAREGIARLSPTE